jgi:DNA-binding IclR family transcriptional regulator
VETIQSIERAAAILRSLAAGERGGRRLIDVTEETGLGKSTAHRILQTLVQVGLVEQDAESGMFYLGFGLLTLGATAADRHGLNELAGPSLLAIADRTGDTVYLSVRSGGHAVCVDRVSGAFPIKTLTLHPGDRRPLGVGAGSLALLAWLPDDQVRRIVDGNAPHLSDYGRLDSATILELVDTSRRQGYAFNDQLLIPGMSAVGLPVRGRNGHPIAAVSVAAISSRMSERRREDIVSWLAEEVAKLEARLGGDSGGLTEPAVRWLTRSLI